MEILLAALGPGLRTASPILLAALGGIFTQRAGVFNIALEGYMLVGAFVAVVVGSATGSVWLALAAALVACTVLALLMAFVVLSLGGDAVVVGIAVNLLAAGLTAFLLQEITDGGAFLRTTASLPNLELPFLADVPILGDLFASQGILVWVALALVPLIAWILARTALGLRMRAVGEHPEAAVSAGVNVLRTQYIAFGLCGALCALAGAQLALGLLSLFSINMTAGRGIIAFAAVIFGAAAPRWVALAALVFGVADAVANRMQAVGLPVQFVLMVPYALTIAVLLIAAVPWRRVLRLSGRAPAGAEA